MPAISTIPLMNSAAETVNYTLKNVKPNNTVEFTNKTGVPKADPALSIAYREPTVNSEFYRIRLSLSLPRATTVDGQVTIASRCSAYLDLVFHEESTTAEREDMMAQLSAAINSSAFDGVATIPEPLY